VPARVAVVTGGGRGIGQAIVATLGQRGYRVAVADIRAGEAEATATAVTASGGEARSYTMDVTRPEQVHEAFVAIADDLGPVEVLVNNIGWDELKPFMRTDEDFWDRILEINFKGALRTCQAVLPSMLERRWGRIVNIGSDAGRVGSSLEAVYSGAKGAVMGFSKALARETARSGVTVNVVCPGPTETPLLDEITAAAADAEKVISAMTGAVAMKRLGRPEEVAGAVAYLCSDEAGFVTGQTLSVSGGLTMV